MVNIGNEKGYSLAELLVSLPLAILVIFIFTYAISNFVTAYQETKLYIHLQEELFEAIETMRYGYTEQGITNDEQLIGLITANKVEIDYFNNSITIKPLILHAGVDYWAKFYMDEGNLKTSGQYGMKSYFGKQIFPKGNKYFGEQPQFELLELDFTAEKTVDDKIYVVGVETTARVRFREKKQNQSMDEDLNSNTKNHFF